MVKNARHNTKVYANGGRNCICQWCNAPFESKRRGKQRYCSDSCRVMSYNDRKEDRQGKYTEIQLEELR